MRLLRSAARFQRRDQDGITMVEMMVILAIIAILALSAYPLLSNLLQVMVSKGASEQVAGAVRQARQYAITEGANRCISFGTTPVTIYRIRELDCSSGALRDQVEIGNGAAVVNPSNLSIMFDPVGRITPATAVNVSISVDTQPPSCASVITVTPFGGVRVSKC